MSNFDNSSLFMEPRTNQYGSHMIMTNVHKPTKTKYVNVDTKFSDDYQYGTNANYNITLPQPITDVKNISVTNIEIPKTYYNISKNLGNTHLSVYDPSASVTLFIDVSDGQYDAASLTAAINASFAAAGLSCSISINENGKTLLSTTYIPNSHEIRFAVDTNSNPDKYGFKNKLGWMLGFRKTTYTITQGPVLESEYMSDLHGPRYLYLAVEEFNRGNQNSFVSPVVSSLINKNILARITMDNQNYGYGSILSGNTMNGLVISDDRSYTGKIDLLKLNVQLIDENGMPVMLNGLDFSFCLKVEHE